MFPLKGKPLRLLLLASALGGSPNERDEDAELAVEINRRDIRVGGHLTRSLHLGKWPRSLAPGFLQGLMAAGAPMDLSVHLGAIPSEQAARTLEWQKVRFESAQSIVPEPGPQPVAGGGDRPGGREPSPGRGAAGTGAAVPRLPVGDAARRQRRRAEGPDPEGPGPLRRHPGQAGQPGLPPEGGPAVHPAPGPERRGGVAHPGHVVSLARLFPFSPPDLDTRSGTLYGIDLRACAPIVYDPFDGTHLNANTAVLARSGSGKSFATKLGVLRGVCRGVRAYVIDPEGEYADMARAAGGRVLSPGIAGQGMNPFVIDRGDAEELLQRIGSLRRLIEVMVGERLSAERRSSLDHALASYYAEHRERTGFRDFYAYLEQEGGGDIAHLLRPFATGSLRHLLSDEGDDLLTHEALVTVFDLHLLEPELRPAAAMVCTETVWAAAAQDPRPRLLVVDEVWSIMQHPEGAAFMVSDGQARPQAPAGVAVHHPGRAGPALRGLLPDHHRAFSGRALLQNAAFKLLLQQDAAAISTVGEAFDLPVELQRWLLSCPRAATGCSWPGATASPSASKPPPRRPRSSSGGPAPGISR